MLGDEFENRENQNQRYEIPPYEGKPVPIRPQSYNTAVASGGPNVPQQEGKVSAVYPALPINASGVTYVLNSLATLDLANNRRTYSHSFTVPAGKVFVLRKFRLRGDVLINPSPGTTDSPVVVFRLDGAGIEGLVFNGGDSVIIGVYQATISINARNFQDTFIIFPENSTLTTFITTSIVSPPYVSFQPEMISLEIYGDLLLSTGVNPAYEIGL